MDPRQPNATRHERDEAGKVVAMHITVHERPETFWECKSVRILDEYEAAGRVVIFNRFETTAHDKVVLLTGYQGTPHLFDARIPEDPDVNGQYKHELVMANKFTPPNLGPLAVAVGDDLDSDIVASLGLPDGAHISVLIEWTPRVRVTETTPSLETLESLARKYQDLEARVSELERR